MKHEGNITKKKRKKKYRKWTNFNCVQINVQEKIKKKKEKTKGNYFDSISDLLESDDGDVGSNGGFQVQKSFLRKLNTKE